MVRGKLVFITGGVRSGKSHFAEQYLMNERAPRNIYVASGVATDREMEQRIAHHQRDRENYPVNWITIEQPRYLEKLVPAIKATDGILWDCVTTWLANELYVSDMEKVEKRLFETIDRLLEKVKVMVVVSNEVLDEQLSSYESVLLYQQWIGRIHQKLVAKADEAYEMEYGLGHQWK
ncbi:bifunctional adenosylcobinamide kinase/adenosylcobinamide-phosphate guanylyltransferase [Psychrobacillus sp. BL-248-WT-3]|uniref:bifunctional adenosylcobinamide kinase/adenosylcobinamide-phosphate guanylyltransferase n=1 Tax=Psychrobacillus sp. BL-248-WT-3 TaxID=2725306 RepID=UPI00146F46A3|nr:bifunctional adenosylcobinamide kinase/adenosylcobinamide-phosphate guanylyltransferase [Psychrobacillus sp. BL-248-WT-3]NME07480.1 bifunctional adenosylcobinamide kinase/adenosylcobinamide-phosphate guanylyltransferase [Psychrobacillus sp. BL-248-WT-3]